MARASEYFSARAKLATAVMALAVAGAATAQDSANQATAPSSANSLRLPQNPQVFGEALPSVVKATAIVNGEIITQTDVNQRVAMYLMGNEAAISPEELEQLRQQVLRNLVDEALQIQAAKAAEIEITEKSIDSTVERISARENRTPQQLARMLEQAGSSMRTYRRQVHGELAWQRLLNAKIESGVSVGDDEVQAVLDDLNASKGTQEYRVGEIFIAAPQTNLNQAVANANQILGQLKQGASFAGFARQYSEASTAAVGGDLGWVRPEQLPDEIATVLRQMGPGQLSNPIPVPGGVSIIAVQDVRRILSPDPRNAVLTLKQVSLTFPPGTTEQQAESRVARLAEAARNVGGCGGADRIAEELNGDLVQSDQVRMRDLPPALQEIMLPMQVGQSTPPFGSLQEGVRILVMCGRDEVDPTAPSFEQVSEQIFDERVNVRARRYLRDLRRDAIIEFR